MNVRNNYDFLKLCLTSRWSESAKKSLLDKQVRDSLNWDDFLLICEEQACGPLIYPVLSNSPGIPDSVMEKLEKSFINCGSANLLFIFELENYLKLLQSNGIQSILLKGAALALSLYENIALRPMLDIDILIHQNDLDRASRLFLELGYLQARLNPQDGILNLYENEVGFGKKGAINYLFELHWSLFDSPYYQSILPIDWFWQNPQYVNLNDKTVLIFPPEAQLLHLCGHLHLHHTGNEFLWINDIAQLLVKYDSSLDWGEIIAQAKKFDLVLPLQRTIQNLATKWYVPIEPKIVEQINQLVPSPAEKRIFNRLTRQIRPPGIRLGDDLDSLPTIQQKVQFAWINLFPSVNYMTKHYRIPHPSLLPLYYVYRWYLGVRSLVTKRQ